MTPFSGLDVTTSSRSATTVCQSAAPAPGKPGFGRYVGAMRDPILNHRRALALLRAQGYRVSTNGRGTPRYQARTGRADVARSFFPATSGRDYGRGADQPDPQAGRHQTNGGTAMELTVLVTRRPRHVLVGGRRSPGMLRVRPNPEASCATRWPRRSACTCGICPACRSTRSWRWGSARSSSCRLAGANTTTGPGVRHDPGSASACRWAEPLR